MATNNIKKAADGYGYKYTELAQINEYLASINTTYYQYTQLEEGFDYVYTVPIVDGKELPPRKGCRIVTGTMKGVNASQDQGAAITYARRYSLLMAFGLATTDTDGLTDDELALKRKQMLAKKLIKTAKDKGYTSDDVLAFCEVEKLGDMTINELENAIASYEKLEAKEEV